MVARAPRGGAHYPLFFQLSLSHTPPPPLLDALPAVVRRAGQDALGDDEHRALRPRRRLADRPRLLLCVERRAARVRRWVELCVCVCVAAGRWLFCRATCAARKCVCALTPNQHTHSSKKPNRRAAAAGRRAGERAAAHVAAQDVARDGRVGVGQQRDGRLLGHVCRAAGRPRARGAARRCAFVLVRACVLAHAPSAR